MMLGFHQNGGPDLTMRLARVRRSFYTLVRLESHGKVYLGNITNPGSSFREE